MCFNFIFPMHLSLSLTGHAVPAAQGEAGPAQLVGGVRPVISPHQGLHHGTEGHGGVQEDTSSGADCEELSAVCSVVPRMDEVVVKNTLIYNQSSLNCINCVKKTPASGG